jgi:hypothetical protein
MFSMFDHVCVINSMGQCCLQFAPLLDKYAAGVSERLCNLWLGIVQSCKRGWVATA